MQRQRAHVRVLTKPCLAHSPLCPDTPLRKTPTSKSADLREKQVLFSEANLPTSCPTSASSTASKDGGEEDMDGARSTHDSPDEARLRLATCEDRVPWPCDATPAADHETQTSTFEFEMLVGSGAFGDVFKAHLMSDTAMWPQGSIFAVKKAKKQFRNEHDRDHVLAEVRHPRVRLEFRLLRCHQRRRAAAGQPRLACTRSAGRKCSPPHTAVLDVWQCSRSAPAL